MKNKFMILLILLFLLTGTVAFAKTYEVSFENKPDFLIISEYDNTLIKNVQVIKPDKDKTSLIFESEAENFSANLIYKDTIKKAQVTEVTLKNEEVQKPETSTSDSEKDFPQVYDIEKDAVRALMVVDSVSMINKDGENKIQLDVFFHGKEMSYLIPEDIVINNVPEMYKTLKDRQATALKKGDVIRITATLSGSIDSLSLIFRPTAKNPLFSNIDYGNGFSKLFSENGIVAGEASYKVSTPVTGLVKKGYGYAFGVIKDRNNDELEISDMNGNILTLDVKNGAIIYKVDIDEKFNVEKSTLSEIRQTSGSKESFNDEDEFIEWSNDVNYGYAFLRTIDGEATEIIIYENY